MTQPKTPEDYAQQTQLLLELTVGALDGEIHDLGEDSSGDPFVDMVQLLREADTPLGIYFRKSREIYPLDPDLFVVLHGAKKHAAIRTGKQLADRQILERRSTGGTNFSIVALSQTIELQDIAINSSSEEIA